jgi:hypothetical protein
VVLMLVFNLERPSMKSASFLVRFRYYFGLILILGSIAGVAWRFRAARILSYDMLPPYTTTVAAPHDSY